MVYPEFIYPNLLFLIYFMPIFAFISLFSQHCATNRSSYQRCSVKKLFLKSFALFTGKYLCWSPSLVSLQELQLYQKEAPTQVFSSEYCKTFNNTYFRNIREHLLLNKCHGVLNVQSPEVFYKKGVFKNFAILTGKHLCQSHFFSKVAGLRLII